MYGFPYWLSWYITRLPMQEMQLQPLGREDPLEKEMAPCSSMLAWKILWTESGRLQSLGWQRVRHNLATKQLIYTFHKDLWRLSICQDKRLPSTRLVTNMTAWERQLYKWRTHRYRNVTTQAAGWWHGAVSRDRAHIPLRAHTLDLLGHAYLLPLFHLHVWDHGQHLSKNLSRATELGQEECTHTEFMKFTHNNASRKTTIYFFKVCDIAFISAVQFPLIHIWWLIFFNF